MTVAEQKRIICGVPYTVAGGEIAILPYPARIFRVVGIRDVVYVRKLASLRLYEFGGWFW